MITIESLRAKYPILMSHSSNNDDDEHSILLRQWQMENVEQYALPSLIPKNGGVLRCAFPQCTKVIPSSYSSSNKQSGSRTFGVKYSSDLALIQHMISSHGPELPLSGRFLRQSKHAILSQSQLLSGPPKTSSSPSTSSTRAAAARISSAPTLSINPNLFKLDELEGLFNRSYDGFIDCIVILLDIGEYQEQNVTTSSGEVCFRKLRAVDQTGRIVDIMVWDERAKNFSLKSGDCVLFVDLKLIRINGVVRLNLDTYRSGQMKLNYEWEMNRELVDWWLENRTRLTEHFRSQVVVQS